MSNNKQTAVEWLVEKLQWTHPDFDAFNEYILKAKEMEKQQIMDAIIDSEKEHIIQAVECYPTGFVIKKAEQYYNKEYGKL